MTQETPEYDQLPDTLVERLKQRERMVGLLTPAADRAVLEAAREQFGAREASRAAHRRWQYPAAAAAAVALLALFIAQPFHHAAVEESRMADDVDGSGRVDVLDVFALARARADGADAVSQNRIDRLADRIVSLDPPDARL